MTKEADSANKGRQVSADIKITPEMVEAGVDALCLSCDEVSVKSDATLQRIVTEVYAAMDSARDQSNYTRRP